MRSPMKTRVWLFGTWGALGNRWDRVPIWYRRGQWGTSIFIITLLTHMMVKRSHWSVTCKKPRRDSKQLPALWPTISDSVVGSAVRQDPLRFDNTETEAIAWLVYWAFQKLMKLLLGASTTIHHVINGCLTQGKQNQMQTYRGEPFRWFGWDNPNMLQVGNKWWLYNVIVTLTWGR